MEVGGSPGRWNSMRAKGRRMPAGGAWLESKEGLGEDFREALLGPRLCSAPLALVIG